MLRNPDFFQMEDGCPLLMKNEGYLNVNSKIALEKTRVWKKYLLENGYPNNKSPSNRMTEEKDKSEKLGMDDMEETAIHVFKEIKKPDRIFVRDAERTFLHEKQRKLLITMLTMTSSQLGDYQQTMCYVCSTLMLYYNPKTVFQMMVVLGRSPSYAMNGYWRAEAVGQSIDAYVLWRIMKTTSPDLYNHLQKCEVLPDTFIQKWFGGLCVQVMPSEHLIDMWTQFFKYGFRYLFKFALSLLDQLKPRLLNETRQSVLYEMLKLEKRSRFYLPLNHMNSSPNRFGYSKQMNTLYHSFFTSVLAGANSIGDKYNLQKIDFQKEREIAYHTYLQKRLLNAAVNVIFQSYLEENKDDDDDIEDCQLCDGFADVYCEECELYLCEDCHDDENGDHQLSHAIKKLDIDID